MAEHAARSPSLSQAHSGPVDGARAFNTAAWCAGSLGAVGVLLWGTASGFQHYLVIVPPVLVLQPGWSAAKRLTATLLSVLAYVLLDVAGPLASMSASVAPFIYRANAVAGLLLLAAMAWVYAGQLRAVQARLRRSVASDPLTGLLNRRSWIENAEALLSRLRQQPRRGAVGVLIVGVDHLKATNDQHGHATGDQVLGTVAAALQRGLRERDLLARWGGDQFIALLASGDGHALRMVGERLRALVQAATVRVPESGEVLSLSASMGIAELDLNEPLDAAIIKADEAMAEAKRCGRNRVVLARA